MVVKTHQRVQTLFIGGAQRGFQPRQLDRAQLTANLAGHLRIQHQHLPATQPYLPGQSQGVVDHANHIGAVIVIAREPVIGIAELGKIALQALIGLQGALVRQVAGAYQQVYGRLLPFDKIDHRLQRMIGIHAQ